MSIAHYFFTTIEDLRLEFDVSQKVEKVT